MRLSLLTTLLTLSLTLLFATLLLHLPAFLPTIIAQCIAQGQHRIDVSRLPMHACPLESCLHHHFMGTFYHSRTNGPACSQKLGILQLWESLAQIAQGFSNGWQRPTLLKPLQMGEDTTGTLVLE